MIVVICGLPGVGKTTLAKQLAPLIDATLLSTDKIRKQLFKEPTYHREERELVYNVMLLIAKYLHHSGTDCILDATFNKEESRQEVKKKLGLPPEQFWIIECKCSENIILSRLQTRKNDYSDAGVSVFPVSYTHLTLPTKA